METVPQVSLSAECIITARDMRIRYSLRNAGATDLYVLNAFAAMDPTTRQPFVDAGGYSLFLQESNEGVVLLGIPPLPANKLVAVRIIPLATKLPSGSTLSRELPPIALPLREHSVYASAEEVDGQYTVNMSKLVLAVQYLSSVAPELQIATVPYAKDYFSVRTRQTVTDAQEVRATLVEKEMALMVFRER